MPQINLSTLSGAELRQMLDASRRRGDAVQSYQVLQEMAARREAPMGRGGFLRRRPAEPRLIPVEADELADDDDLPPLPTWRRPELADAAPPPTSSSPVPSGAIIFCAASNGMNSTSRPSSRK